MKKLMLITDAVLMVLIFIPVTTSASITLQYDDGGMESSGAVHGQAVRFSVPSSGTGYRIEDLTIYVSKWISSQTIRPTIWEDNGGSLAGAVGTVLYEGQDTVGNLAWYDFDVSTVDIIISPGGSFFAGWTSPDWLTARWDSTNPDYRSVSNPFGTGWTEWPYDVDAPIRAVISPIPAAIEAAVDLDPDVFEVKVKEPKEPKKSKEPKEEFLNAFIELPADVNVADVDVNTVTLSLNGTMLATAELPVIVDNILDVLFPLDPNNVCTILGLEVTKVKVHGGKIEVEATVTQCPPSGGATGTFGGFGGFPPGWPPIIPPILPLPPQTIDLIELTVSGELISGGSFSGTDAVRVMLKKHHGD